MTTVDPLTPIFNALAGERKYAPPGRGAHAMPSTSACAPVEWFGPPVHGREGAATEVMPVVDEQERKAS
jgi:hypothetical protein